MSNVVGDCHALTAFAPALTSPLRKTAPYGRPVHRLGDRAGRSPGSRVVAQLRPAFPVSQWPYGRELAAYSCGGSHGLLQTRAASVFPLSSPGFARGTSTLKCSSCRKSKSRPRSGSQMGRQDASLSCAKFIPGRGLFAVHNLFFLRDGDFGVSFAPSTAPLKKGPAMTMTLALRRLGILAAAALLATADRHEAAHRLCHGHRQSAAADR